MKIGVDAHVLAGKFQGSRTYLLNLYQHVIEKQKKDKFVFYGHWNNEDPYGKDVEYVNFKSKSKMKRLTYETYPLLKENKIDLYHTTYISPMHVPCDTIVTIHDILFETHPQFFTPQEVWRNKILVRRSAKKAKQIHTVSEFSKLALIDLYGIPEHKIHIVPNGVDLSKFTPGNKEEAKQMIKDKYGVEDYLLTVGRIEPRKNHIQLLNAYKILKERNVGVGKLVIVGKPDFGFKQFFTKIDEMKLNEDVKIIDSVDDSILPDIYRAAQIFVYPSFAEGFGIPPLEAMACGIPVISSNTTAIPEVVGDAGLLINPMDPEDIASNIERLWNDPDLISSLIVKGLSQANKWTWTNAANVFLHAMTKI